MTLTQKFLQATKNVPSWFFNNNGNEVDKTKIRLHDGSPVHSTGSTWLRSQWKEIVTVTSSPFLLYPAPFYSSGFLVSVTALSIGLKGFEHAMDREINPHQSLCINTDQHNKSLTSLDNLNKAKMQTISSIGVSLILTSIGAATYLPLFLPLAIAELRTAHRFNKVLNGDWVIEEMPKPIKKKSIAEELGLDKLVQQEQKLVPIPIPPPRRD